MHGWKRWLFFHLENCRSRFEWINSLAAGLCFLEEWFIECVCLLACFLVIFYFWYLGWHLLHWIQSVVAVNVIFCSTANIVGCALADHEFLNWSRSHEIHTNNVGRNCFKFLLYLLSTANFLLLNLLRTADRKFFESESTILHEDIFTFWSDDLHVNLLKFWLEKGFRWGLRFCFLTPFSLLLIKFILLLGVIHRRDWVALKCCYVLRSRGHNITIAAAGVMNNLIYFIHLLWWNTVNFEIKWCKVWITVGGHRCPKFAYNSLPITSLYFFLNVWDVLVLFWWTRFANGIWLRIFTFRLNYALGCRSKNTLLGSRADCLMP